MGLGVVQHSLHQNRPMCSTLRMTVSSIIVSSIILTVTIATTWPFDCPQMCDCKQSNNSDTELAVDCAGRHAHKSILVREMNSLLSDDELRETLTMLNISNTPLTQVPMSICQLKKLKFLHLDANRLHRLPDNCFTNMVALRNLSARQNKITALQNGLFDGLNSLVVVDFSLNKIASIGLHVFSNPNDLVNLRQIVLDNNRLRSLEPWPYIRGLHGSRASKVHISINANFISEFTNGIKWQFSCSRPSYAILNITGNYVRHFNSIPYGWNVSAPEWKCTMYPNSDQFRSPAFEVVFALSHNYHCDCVDMPYIILATFDDTYHMYKSVRCNQPLSLANRSVMDVGWDKFVCEMPKGCPPSCRCVYRPFNCTLHVYCSTGNLSSLPLDLPPLPGYYGQVTYNLDFSNNKLLKRLDYRPYFANTSILDVSNCAIDVVDLNVLREFPTMLSQLQNCNFFSAEVSQA